jgi:hypothetical protein
MLAPERYLGGNGRSTLDQYRASVAVSPEWVDIQKRELSKGMAPVRQNCLALDSATTRVSYLSKGTSSPARQRQEPDRLLCPATGITDSPAVASWAPNARISLSAGLMALFTISSAMIFRINLHICLRENFLRSNTQNLHSRGTNASIGFVREINLVKTV